mmetsp:Transcript_55251/g.131723  ORF Transcript_55251/g.131723 Transcript_55251/m.131723 type:complete len:270 (+) Transcript_55251:57-866(+)
MTCCFAFLRRLLAQGLTLPAAVPAARTATNDEPQVEVEEQVEILDVAAVHQRCQHVAPCADQADKSESFYPSPDAAATPEIESQDGAAATSEASDTASCLQEDQSSFSGSTTDEPDEEKAFAIRQVTRCGFFLGELNDTYQADAEVVLAAVQQSGHALLHCAEELLNNRDFILKVVERSGVAFAHIPAKFQADEEVALKACRQWGYALKHVAKGLNSNREIVVAAICSGRGNALRYASEDLQEDSEVLELALKYGYEMPRPAAGTAAFK